MSSLLLGVSPPHPHTPTCTMSQPSPTFLTQRCQPGLYSLEQLEGAIDEEGVHSRAFLHEQVFDLEAGEVVRGGARRSAERGEGGETEEGSEQREADWCVEKRR